jgi:hypothetical protein
MSQHTPTDTQAVGAEPPVPQEFSAATAAVLECFGWRLVSQAEAARWYPGGIAASVTSDGRWLLITPRGRIARQAQDAIQAAREADSNAVGCPEYLAFVFRPADLGAASY